jgi:hypothetical protein
MLSRVSHRRQIQSRVHGTPQNAVCDSLLLLGSSIYDHDSLQRFLERIARHPLLQRASLVRSFFESSEWVYHICFLHEDYTFEHLLQNVTMHQHIAHPPTAEAPQGIIDNLSDTLLNAFARVRKPDERFTDMREHVDKFEEGLNVSERIWQRIRSRTSGESPLFPPNPVLKLKETVIRNPPKT